MRKDKTKANHLEFFITHWKPYVKVVWLHLGFHTNVSTLFCNGFKWTDSKGLLLEYKPLFSATYCCKRAPRTPPSFCYSEIVRSACWQGTEAFVFWMCGSSSAFRSGSPGFLRACSWMGTELLGQVQKVFFISYVKQQSTSLNKHWWVQIVKQINDTCQKMWSHLSSKHPGIASLSFLSHRLKVYSVIFGSVCCTKIEG